MNMTDILTDCQFCHSKNCLEECHGHYHCTKCGAANFECCSGEMAQSGWIDNKLEKHTKDNWPTLRYNDPDFKY